MSRRLSFLLLLLLPWTCPASAEDVQRLRLDNAALEFELTPAFGGRVLGLRLRGEPNLLKIGEAVQAQPSPRVAADAGDIAYLGHDVWVGPQRDWWLQQRVNPARRAAAANWPPDPYLGFATTTVVSASTRAIELLGVASPVSGVQLRKRFALSTQRADTLVLDVEARNIRQDPVAWDLWFNTRVDSATRVFVPMAQPGDLRLQAEAPGFAAPAFRHAAGVLVLAADGDRRPQRGKLLIQPSAGWMAAFRGRQMLLLRFDHQPRERIHPQQGQVELYLDAPADGAAGGLLELEVHAPYRTLVPGARMQAGEQWTLLRYPGADNVQAQRAFLCGQAAELGLDGACTQH